MTSRSTGPADAPVRDFRGVHYPLKWRETLRAARREQDAPASAIARAAARRPISRPVFILGSPRSGTTYLGSLMAHISSASYFFEPPMLKYLARKMYEGSWPAWRSKLEYGLGLRTLLLAAPGSGPRVFEKNPNHTWVAEQLLAIFPDAQFIAIIRDGRDVAVSLSEKPWHRLDRGGETRREPGGYLTGTHPHFYIEQDRRLEYSVTSDLHRCCWIWRRHTEELMRLRSALPPGVYREIRYEQLLSDPDTELPELLRWLEEDQADSLDAVLKAAQSGHRRSIGRWRETLGANELAEIEAECAPLLQQLGYD